MNTSLILDKLRFSVQRREVAIILALAMPWSVAAIAIASRWPAFGLIILVLSWLAVAFIAWRTLRKMDVIWLSRGLNLQRHELEDSAELLFTAKDTLSWLARLQQARLERRLASMDLPDLRSPWPTRRLVINALLAVIVTLATLFLPNASRHEKPLTSAAVADRATTRFTHIVSQRLDIEPLRYTGLPRRHENALDVKVQQGSLLQWRFVFSQEPKTASLQFHDGSQLLLQHKEGAWTANKRLLKSTLYRVVLIGVPALLQSPLHRIDVMPDRPPLLRIISPERSLSLREDGQRQWELLFEASDDFGISGMQLHLTLAQGNGENISVSSRVMNVQGTGTARQKRYAKSLDLTALGLAVGDDAIVRMVATDNRTPVPQITRSQSFILRWPPDAGAEATDVEGLVKRTLPAYFRSQRQIIIDSESLLAERKKLSSDDYVLRADTIGVDQRILRLRYGEFLGEETGGAAQIPTPTNDGATEAPADEHAEGGASDSGHAVGDATSVVEAYGHTHDHAEAATLLDAKTRAMLKLALDQMWQSELHLRQGRPDLALPFEYRALGFIKRIQQASRIYLARVGLALPAIDEGRRLQGERKGLTDRRDVLVTAKLSESPVLLLWQALEKSDALPLVEFAAFERWLYEHDSEVPDALGLYARLDELRRLPQCADCSAKLRAQLWPLLPSVVPEVSPRQALDDTGRAYLDALQREPNP